MKNVKYIMIALFMGIAVVGKAQLPASVNPASVLVNPNSQRYVLYFEDRWVKNCFKLDTRTGELWEIKGDWKPEKIEVIEFTGIDHPKESQSYDGRFIYRPMAYNGYTWIYIFDSLTGDLWSCKRGSNPEYEFHLITPSAK